MLSCVFFSNTPIVAWGPGGVCVVEYEVYYLIRASIDLSRYTLSLPRCAACKAAFIADTKFSRVIVGLGILLPPLGLGL